MKEGQDPYARKIYNFYMTSRRMPSYSEMQALFAFSSKNAVYKRVLELVKRGLVGKDHKGRLIPTDLLKLGKVRAVRILGTVAAGFPSPAEEELNDTMSLDEYLISNPQATYLLKVDGDSMIDAWIRPGDLVLVQKNLQPKRGDIVVAQVDGEWTLKYFVKSAGQVLLKAGNTKYPEITPRQELVIAGVVIAYVRKYK